MSAALSLVTNVGSVPRHPNEVRTKFKDFKIMSKTDVSLEKATHLRQK